MPLPSSYQYLLDNKARIYAHIASLHQAQELTTPLPEVMLVTKYHTIKETFPLLLDGMTILGENYLEGYQAKISLLQALTKVFSSVNFFKRFLTALESGTANHMLPALTTTEITELAFLTDFAYLADEQPELFGTGFPKFELHYIGQIQSRKAKNIAILADYIDSLASEKVALRLQQAREELSQAISYTQPLQVMLQLKSPDCTQPNRAGLSPRKLHDLIALIQEQCPQLQIAGLMFIASPENHLKEYEFAQKVFQDFQAKYQFSNFKLSMGMTDSIDVSLTHGTNMLRIGTAFFNQD